MVALNQTVTIVNKGGKIVSTSKHLVNVFAEAKSAYNERKAEIKVLRKSEHESKHREHEARDQFRNLTLDGGDVSGETEEDNVRAVRTYINGYSVRRKPVPGQGDLMRPPVERGVSDGFYAANIMHDEASHVGHGPSRSGAQGAFDDDPRAGELTRRNTDGLQLQTSRHTKPRRASVDDIDMDLAYGELPPPLADSRLKDEVELRSKMHYLQRLLDEGNCVQHSVTAIIDNLQKNPEALAAVALTLAEISNLAAKMAPGALAAMKTSFPAILALLASPQFAIAAGVGVGVTIIALGGYKIIKRIQAKNAERLLEPGFEASQGANDPDDGADQLRELNRIETWRRGIAHPEAGAEAEAGSQGTSVEGEFITPVATRTLIGEGKLTEGELKPIEGGSNLEKKKSRKKAKSEASSKSKKSSKGTRTKMKRENSLLRSLFKGHS